MPRVPSLSPRHALLHPLFWLGLVTLLLNDHFLKHAGILPPLATGKLSDLAGLVVAPAVLAALVGVRSLRAWVACHAAVGAGFAVVNIWPDAVLGVAHALTALGVPSRLWCDPTDLFALPALWLSHRVLGDAAARSVDLGVLWRATLSRGGLALGLLGCVATSRMPPPRVAADAERAYVPLVDDRQVAVVDASSGSEVGRFDHALQSFPQPIVIEGVLVGFGEVDGTPRLLGIDVATGELRFTAKARAADSVLPLLGAGSLVITLRRPDKEGVSYELAAYEAKTGELRWTRIVPDAMDLTLHVRDDIVLIGRSGGVERLDPSTGARRWELGVTEDVVSMAAFGGRVFIQLDNDAILGVDDASGRVVVRRQIEARKVRAWTTTAGSLTASDRALFLLADGGGVHVLDAELRQIRQVADVWTITAEGPHVIANLKAFTLARLDAATGEIRWKADSPIWSDGFTLNEGLAINAGDDEVVAFDLETGHQRWLWKYPRAREE